MMILFCDEGRLKDATDHWCEQIHATLQGSRRQACLTVDGNVPTRRSTAFKAPAIRDVFQSKHAALLVGWEKIIEERTALSKLLILSNMHGCVRLEEWSFLSTITFYGVVESFVKVASLE